MRKTQSNQAAAVKLVQIIEEEHQVFLTGVILMEILQGVREVQQASKIRRYLECFPLLELDRLGYMNAASLHSKCRSKGIQSGTVDALIAQTAIEKNCYLLTVDQDFEHIARCTSLKLMPIAPI